MDTSINDKLVSLVLVADSITNEAYHEQGS